MRLSKVTIENVRSFLDREELTLDGQISILIGPNGGGKTNLLDAIVILLRRYLFASMWAAHRPTPEQPQRHIFQDNDVLNNMILQKHSSGAALPQLVEAEVEVTARDIESMRSIKNDAKKLKELAGIKYDNLTIQEAEQWNLDLIKPGQKFKYRIANGAFGHDEGDPARYFLRYLRLFEINSRLREEYGLSPLSTPMLYLPVNRTVNDLQSNIQLSNYNEYEQKRQYDAVLSRSNSSIVSLAIGRIAQKYRLLLEKDQGNAGKEFRKDKNLVEMTKLLKELGYEWDLESTDPLKNQYDIRLKKQGTSFLVGAASSGERELLTYLFGIFALNVRDALIIVDEPELHLHPKWQKALLQLFVRLAETTGNQFLLATHSPIFVSPESIQFVSRVFSRNQKSNIMRLDARALPEMKHLLNIVNSHNNERIFFADEVILVEGLSDRIFFEAVLDKHGRKASSSAIVEVVSVGGKHFFEAYKKILNASQIKYSIIADLDYVEQIGSSEIKSLFKPDSTELKKDVIENVGSLDGAALVSRIDEAIKTGNLSDAKATWEYIKSRHRQLRDNLTPKEQETLRDFLKSKRAENIYVLAKGNLESYLPIGYRSKNLEKLIELLASPDFWDRLAADARDELSDIARILIAAAL